MAPEVLEVDIDFKLTTKSALVDEHGRPRKVWAEVYNSDDALVYPPAVLVGVAGDELGLHLRFLGALWTLGSQGVGPMIARQEYVSGFDKLSNGSFALGELYWRRASEESLWLFGYGLATCAGGFRGDDVLESDEKFPTRPGHQHQLLLSGVTGTGHLRSRIIYEGKFNPPELWVNGDFSNVQVGWTPGDYTGVIEDANEAYAGDYVMMCLPIAKPQLVTGPDFSTGWTLGDTMNATGGKLYIEETPKPQYLAHVAGVDDFTVSPYVTWTNADPTKVIGASGYYHQMGPIGQLQVVLNGSFESGLTDWLQYAGAWSTSSATHVHGANAATTGGVAGGALKNLQVAVALPGAVGETWRFDAYLCSGTIGTSDEADGLARVQVYLVDQAYPLYDSWLDLVSLDGDDKDKDQWHYGQTSFSVPPDKPFFVPMLTIYGHTAGSWYLDGVSATRTSGNNTGIYSAEFDAIPNQRYTFSTLFVKSDPRIDGSMTLRLIFKGPGKPDVESTTSLSQTYGQWRSLSVDGTCPKGYTTMVAAIDGDDVLGGSFYIDSDYTLLQKADNNTDRATGTPFAVTPSQKYLGSATIERLVFVEKGMVRVGVVLSGPGVDDVAKYVDHSFGEDDEAAARVTWDITPEDGYDTATPFVLVKDLAGGEGGNVVAVSRFTVEQSDNNRTSIDGTGMAVTPERTYKAKFKARSGANLQRGNVRLEMRFTRAGYPDVTVESNTMDNTENEWKEVVSDITPPSGYSLVLPRVIFTDIEGDLFYASHFSLIDTDTATAVFDAISTLDPLGASPYVDSVAPQGAETVRAAVVVEEGSGGWSVDAVSLKRTGVTPATGNAIWADLLTDPETGLPLSIVAGTISAPDVIPYDIEFVNRTNRDAADHVCAVVYDGGLEYRVNATAPATIDVAPSADLFTDHGPGSATPITLLPEDIDVQELDDPEVDVSERATVIRLFGAERQTVSGRPFLITADAEVPGNTEYDWNGNPIVRVKPVNDGTVDHHGYAQAFATDLALRESEPALNLNVKLSGKDTRPPFDVGSWLYVYHPEAGLKDDDNPQEIEGQTVFPRRVRVLSRERTLGPSYRIVMRRSDGSTFSLPGVIPSPEDATVLTIGDRLPEWQADPQGMVPGVQYLRDRASRPR